MMAGYYAAVDWGTSSFRLWIIGEDGAVLAERRSAEGMTTVRKTVNSLAPSRRAAAI